MTTKAKFMALAAAHGIEVEYLAGRKRHPRTGEPVAFEITLDAPKGKVFAGSATHVDCSMTGWATDDLVLTTPDWANEYRGLQAIIADGFEDCDDPDCDYCRDNEEG